MKPTDAGMGGSYRKLKEGGRELIERTAGAAGPVSPSRQKRPGDRIRLPAYSDGTGEMEIIPGDTADNEDAPDARPEETPAPAATARKRKGR